ncbi:ribbon-helix-helix domain-containing protein [Granulicella tundricola]|uniref:Transcriptional regulator n=1 Tax=Granulicella tundricola (strain ATCC BAA-1859 / DSM 23138 / MP5ACTX9) TaxID=1198114 RepID=E8X3H7_GRATM|nr:type II toxin-antitoxin system ParD family antitoxin [Granulicella tundricola]ADW68168.1 transcriptional regulator [Granulicella tundricola MP5ACTX9]
MANTISITLPDSIKAYVDAQIEAGFFGNLSDYFRELALDDRDRHLARLEDRLVEAIKSEPITFTDEEWENGDLIALGRERLARLK